MGRQKKELAQVIGLLMLHMVTLEAVVITLAALLPDDEIDHVQTALDQAGESAMFRREDRQHLSAIGDALMTQILERMDEVRGD